MTSQIKCNDKKLIDFFLCVHALPIEGIGDVPDDSGGKNLQIFHRDCHHL